MTIKTAKRSCSVCGLFYPADAGELRRSVTAMLAAANPPEIEGTIRGIVGPHAGYTYSGQTAAFAYALLRGSSYSTVVVVSPSHREYFDGISVFPGDAYVTPLGAVPVDEELREGLLQNSHLVRSSKAGHGEEHAVEVHLPFLQCALGEFRFLPVVMGDQKREYCFGLGKALGVLLKDQNALLVASTDLSHYYTADVANKLDAVAIDDIGKFDYESLMRDLDRNHTEACGGGPVVAVMLALHSLGVRKMSILHHCNSGDVTGDFSQVVGYLAAVAYA